MNNKKPTPDKQEIKRAYNDLNIIRDALDSTTTSLVSLRWAFGIIGIMVLAYVLSGILYVVTVIPESLGLTDMMLKYAFQMRTIPGSFSTINHFPISLIVRILLIAATIVVCFVSIKKQKPGLLAKRILFVWIIILSLNLLSASALSSGAVSAKSREIYEALVFPPVIVLPSTGFYQVHFILFTFALGIFVTGLFTNLRFTFYIAGFYAILGFLFQPIVGLMWYDIKITVICVNILFALPFPALTIGLSLKIRSTKRQCS